MALSDGPRNRTSWQGPAALLSNTGPRLGGHQAAYALPASFACLVNFLTTLSRFNFDR